MATMENTTDVETATDSYTFDDSEFCTFCGCIINTTEPTLPNECVACGQPINASAIIGKVKKYTLVLTPWDFYLGSKKAKKAAAAQEASGDGGGPMDETRECSKCGHRGMHYSTMQLRSADEGQTVFYLCPNKDCRNREVENS